MRKMPKMTRIAAMMNSKVAMTGMMDPVVDWCKSTSSVGLRLVKTGEPHAQPVTARRWSRAEAALRPR
jgi:hypothetical protein